MEQIYNAMNRLIFPVFAVVVMALLIHGAAAHEYRRGALQIDQP